MEGQESSGKGNSEECEFDGAIVSEHARCGFCFLEVETSKRTLCPRCQAVYHPDCLRTNENRCAIYGCIPGRKKKQGVRDVPRVVVALIAAVSVGLILVALAFAGSRPGIRVARITSCANNLSQLWKMQHVYAQQFGGPMKRMSEETGKDFWRTLTTTQPPLINQDVIDIFLCPVKGDGRPGDFDYLGPMRPVSQLSDQHPVGGDDLKNHQDDEDGGNILRKSGDVVEIPKRDWATMVSLLKP